MSLILFVTVSLVSLGPLYVGFGQEEEEEANIPKLRDSTLKMELVASGIESPTSMAFLGPNDVLVLEKDKGTVQRIVSGEISEEPILDVNVNAEDERGLLGIAVSKNSSTERTYVFLFYTEAEGTEDGGEPIANRLYRYELVDGELANPTLLLDLPYLPGPGHQHRWFAAGHTTGARRHRRHHRRGKCDDQPPGGRSLPLLAQPREPAPVHGSP